EPLSPRDGVRQRVVAAGKKLVRRSGLRQQRMLEGTVDLPRERIELVGLDEDVPIRVAAAALGRPEPDRAQVLNDQFEHCELGPFDRGELENKVSGTPSGRSRMPSPPRWSRPRLSSSWLVSSGLC